MAEIKRLEKRKGEIGIQQGKLFFKIREHRSVRAYRKGSFLEGKDHLVARDAARRVERLVERREKPFRDREGAHVPHAGTLGIDEIEGILRFLGVVKGEHAARQIEIHLDATQTAGLSEHEVGVVPDAALFLKDQFLSRKGRKESGKECAVRRKGGICRQGTLCRKVGALTRCEVGILGLVKLGKGHGRPESKGRRLQREAHRPDLKRGAEILQTVVCLVPPESHAAHAEQARKTDLFGKEIKEIRPERIGDEVAFLASCRGKKADQVHLVFEGIFVHLTETRHPKFVPQVGGLHLELLHAVRRKVGKKIFPTDGKTRTLAVHIGERQVKLQSAARDVMRFEIVGKGITDGVEVTGQGNAVAKVLAAGSALRLQIHRA